MKAIDRLTLTILSVAMVAGCGGSVPDNATSEALNEGANDLDVDYPASENSADTIDLPDCPGDPRCPR